MIHQRDRLPHHNLELFSNAPITRLRSERCAVLLAAGLASDALAEAEALLRVGHRGLQMQNARPRGRASSMKTAG